MMPMPTIDDEQRVSSGGRLVTPDGRTLPLEGTSLETTACGGIARTILRQRFRNVFDEPLQVRYQVPLPADGAVSGYAFVIGDRRVVGEVDKKKAARERYEQALVEGRSAALLEQDRSSLFTQDLGNIPAGATLVAELTIDQKLRWLPEGRWEWRFPTVAAPRYLGGRVPDAERVAIDVADREMSPRAQLSLRIVDDEARPDSPTHGLRIERDGRHTLVGFKDEGARLDRDIAVSWPAGGDRPSVALSVARRKSAHGLLTLVPPRDLGPSDEVARDLIVLIDTSGSMHGEPLAQAKRVCMALIDSLSDRDSLALIEFSMRARSWRSEPARATSEAKADARRWVSSLEAGGGTEMMTGILAALEPLRSDAQRQVVIVSDGLIGFEHEVVGAIMNKLPRSSRVHTVGVGSAVNRSLTAAAARAGRGYEGIVGIGEDPERIAERLVMRTRAPVIVDVAIEGSALLRHAPARVGDLYASAPTLCALELAASGGELVVSGRSARGSWQERMQVPPIDEDQGEPAVVALFARESVEDLEMRVAAGEKNLDEQIEALGLSFQIATRLTSWVAVSETVDVDPTKPMRRERIPHELPFGMSVAKLGLRSATVYALGAPLAEADDEIAATVMRAHAPRAPSPMSSRDAPPPPPMGMAPPPFEGKAKGYEERTRVTSISRGLRDDGFAATRLELIGRLLLARDDGLVLEVAPGAMHWEPRDVRVELEDGTIVEARIVVEQTTRPGRILEGQLVRLTLRWDGPATAAPSAVTLSAVTLTSVCEMLIRLS